MQTSSRQHTFWLLAALAAPVAHFSGCGWVTAGLTALAVLPLTWIPRRWEGFPRSLARIQLLWLGVVAGCLLSGSGAYWPSDHRMVVPLTILVLAAVTNAAAAPRIGAVLAFCIGLLALPAAVSGAAHLKPEWLKPAAASWSPGLAVALLLPALPAAGGKEACKRVLAGAVMTVLLAVVIQGVVAPEVAVTMDDAFYQTARTLGHLELVVAVGMTLGWYAMTILLLQSGKELAENGGLDRKTASVLPVGTAAGFLLFLQQPCGWILPVLSVLLWVLIPFLQVRNFFEKR